MEVKIRHAYTLRPTPEQAEQIDFFCGCARFAYNALLADVKAQLEETGRFDIMSSVELKAEHPFLKKPDKFVVDYPRRQLERGVRNWSSSKKGKRKGRRFGFPTFHKKDGREDSYTTNNTHNNATGHDSIRIEDGGVRLPKIKEPVSIVLDRPFPKGATIHSVTVRRRRDGVYKISFCLHYDMETLSRPFDGVEDLRVIGLDMSLNEFAVSSDPEERTHGTYVRQNRMFRRRLARLQRRVSRKKLVPTGATYYSRKWQKDAPAKVRSKNREKARRRHARLSQRIANRRKDFVVKLARYYAMNYDVIVLAPWQVCHGPWLRGVQAVAGVGVPETRLGGRLRRQVVSELEDVLVLRPRPQGAGAGRPRVGLPALRFGARPRRERGSELAGLFLPAMGGCTEGTSGTANKNACPRGVIPLRGGF